MRSHKSISKRIVNKGALDFSSVSDLFLFVCVLDFFIIIFQAMKSSCETAVKKIEIMLTMIDNLQTMISKIISVRIRCESVFDGIY